MTVDYNLLSQARSTDADLRQKAAAQIAQSLSEDELPLVFEMLGDRDWRVRKTIVEGLLRLLKGGGCCRIERFRAASEAD